MLLSPSLLFSVCESEREENRLDAGKIDIRAGKSKLLCICNAETNSILFWKNDTQLTLWTHFKAALNIFYKSNL